MTFVTPIEPHRLQNNLDQVSPAGTESTLMSPRQYDYEASKLTNWPFMSVFYWGEQAVGLWTLRVRDTQDYSGHNGFKREVLQFISVLILVLISAIISIFNSTLSQLLSQYLSQLLSQLLSQYVSQFLSHLLSQLLSQYLS